MSETKEKPKQIQRRYGAPEVTRALTAVAYANGNTAKAARDLAEESFIEKGFVIDDSLLWRWKSEVHIEEYERIRQTILPQIRRQAGDEHLDLASRQMAVNRQILERLGKEVDDLPAKELPGASRNMSVGAAVETQKAQLLHEQPTERRAVDLPSMLKELQSLGVEPKKVLNLEPVSEEDAEVVEDSV